MPGQSLPLSFFFFNDTATTEIYTLSLHDALPISQQRVGGIGGAGKALLEPVEVVQGDRGKRPDMRQPAAEHADRKSTRLNSSHANISYAVFCLKKKKRQSLVRLLHRLQRLRNRER